MCNNYPPQYFSQLVRIVNEKIKNYLKKMKKVMYLRGVLLFLVVVLMSCKEDTDKKIAQIEATELAKGVRYDSLFLGLYLGMPNKDFYSKCWELNKQGILLAGSGNESVSLKTTELKHPATINFYPTFRDNKIVEMPLQFQYDSWAPWVRYAQPDSLQLDVLSLMERKYGRGFIKTNDKIFGLTFTKIEGNRKILIFQKPEMYVRVVFSDLTAVKKANQPNQKKG